MIHSLWLSVSDKHKNTSVFLTNTFGWSPLFLPAIFPSAQGPEMLHLMIGVDCKYLLHFSPEAASGEIERVGTLGQTPGGCCLVVREDGGSVSLSPHHTTWSVPKFFP